MANWGASVYALYNKIGGTIRGNICEFDGMNVSLDVLRNGAHILLVPCVGGGKSPKYTLLASAQTAIELASGYTLKVSGKTLVEKIKYGFAKKDEKPRVTGFSRCDKQLNVDTDNTDLTQKLFAKSDFRRAVLDVKGLTVSVCPVAGSANHTVSVTCKIGLDNSDPVARLEKMIELTACVRQTIAETV